MTRAVVTPADGTVATTERLRLREATDADAPFFVEMLRDPGFVEMIGDRGVRSLDEARTYVQDRIRASYARHGYGMYVVERLPDGAALGQCGLVYRDAFAWTELGYALLPAHAGHGYATEAARATLRLAGALGLSEVHATVRAHNAPSVAVLERLGFVPSGTVTMPGETEALRHFRHGLVSHGAAARTFRETD